MGRRLSSSESADDPSRRAVLRRTAYTGLAAAGASTVFGRALTSTASAHEGHRRAASRMTLTADRLFDGRRVIGPAVVRLRKGRIEAVEEGAAGPGGGSRMALGNATILPGFIDLHVHVTFRGVPFDRIIEHGVTTVRDLGGSLPSADDGPGKLRYVAAGPMLTAPDGYPVPVFGPDVAAEVTGPEDARRTVRRLVAGGAQVIKVSLEPGGSHGAPWTTGHEPTSPPPWPMLSPDTVASIVDEAHAFDLIVSAHLSEDRGAQLALDAGVDEWAHVPCERIPEHLLERAVAQDVAIVCTLDTLAHCEAVHHNAHRLGEMGARLLYGTDMAHTEIPWGIDAQELHLMLHTTGRSVEQTLSSATALAGRQLGLAPLGSLERGAPADLIAVRGNPLKDFKLLEYPDLVMGGGALVVNRFDT